MKCNIKPIRNFVWILFCALLTLPYQAVAQNITENARLSFGKVVLVDNNAQREIILNPGGGYTADPQYIFFTDPQLANISVDGYTPNTTLTVTLGTANLTRPGGGSAFFSIGDVFTNPAIIVTDPLGSATFEVGATLTSNGNGAVFTDNNYDGTYTVTVTE